MPTLKDRKRILNKEGTPAKVVQKLDQSPVFRQNGYNLKFDSVNSDRLDLGTRNDFTTINNFELHFEGDIDIQNSFYYLVIGKGSSERFRFRSGSTFFVLEFLNFSGGNQQYFSPALSNGLHKVEITISGGVINYNGTDVFTFVDDDLTGLNGASKPIYAYNNGGAAYGSGNLYELRLMNETFNFSESYGTTITGDNGAVATINTSSAQAENYTNTEIWQKNDFALAFDAVNEEYLDLESNYNFTTINNFELKLNIQVNADLGNKYYLFIGGLYDYFRVRTTGEGNIFVVEFVGANITEQKYFSPSISGSTNLNITVSNGVLNFNGANVKTFIDEDISYINDNTRITVNSLNPNLNGNSTLHSLSIQNEQLPLKVGLGNTITGSNGTVGTINTSVAQAKDRINFGMWLYGNDVDGWEPYIK